MLMMFCSVEWQNNQRGRSFFCSHKKYLPYTIFQYMYSTTGSKVHIITVVNLIRHDIKLVKIRPGNQNHLQQRTWITAGKGEHVYVVGFPLPGETHKKNIEQRFITLYLVYGQKIFLILFSLRRLDKFTLQIKFKTCRCCNRKKLFMCRNVISLFQGLRKIVMKNKFLASVQE